ncbi:MAG: exo-alpha-sialidase, partial [Haloarculaceae archaeon]
PVSLDFQYDEPDGDTKLSDTHEVAVAVEPAEGDGGGFPLPLLVGGLVVVGIGSVYVYRH